MNRTPSLETREEQLYNCTRCTVCKWSPAIQDERFATICPSFDYARTFAFAGGGRMIAGYGLLHGQLQADDDFVRTAYACSMCGGCDTACKTIMGTLVEPLDSLYAIRQRLVENGRLPAPLATLTRLLRDTGNRFGRPAAAREEWLDAPDLRSLVGRKAAVLVHVGDAAFTRSAWPGLQAVVRRMLAAGLDITLGGAAEPDCGGLAFEIGEQALAGQLATTTLAWMKASGAGRVITLGDDAFAAFRNLYPRMGLRIDFADVLHVSEWLAQAGEPAAAERETVTPTTTVASWGGCPTPMSHRRHHRSTRST